MDFPQVGAHYQLGDPKRLCGPVICALGEVKCPYGHPKDCPNHSAKSNGKPFLFKEHAKECAELGFTKAHPELEKMCQAGKVPSGNPVKTLPSGAVVYPPQHFA